MTGEFAAARADIFVGRQKGRVMKFIRLTQGFWAVVDDEDYQRLNRFKWFAHNSGNGIYAARNKPLRKYRKTTQFLHHAVLNFQPHDGLVVDHIDRNTLDCRKSNLRICTRAQNTMNQGPRADKRTSKYKGVNYFRTRMNKEDRWQATIRHNKKAHYLGIFKDEFSAVKAYNVYAYRLHGRFAYLNPWTGPTHIQHSPTQIKNP